MMTTRFSPPRTTSLDLTGLFTTVALYETSPPVVVVTWYESWFSSPLTSPLRSNDGIAMPDGSARPDGRARPVDGAAVGSPGAVGAPPDGAPDAVPPPHAASTRATGMRKAPAVLVRRMMGMERGPPSGRAGCRHTR